VIWAYLLLAVVPQDISARDYVERLEVNNYHDDNGHLVFTQVVGWQANERARFWRMAKTIDATPRPDRIYGGHVLRFLDGDVLRVIRARSCEETWTQYDVELYDRQFLDKEQRHPLRKPCTPSK